MKKTYIQPELIMVKLHGSNLCLVIGSANQGYGTDLVKGNSFTDQTSRPSYSVWDDDWRATDDE